MSDEQESTDIYHWLGDEAEEPEYALNEAAIYFDDENRLIVIYGEGRTMAIELNSDHEKALVRTVLNDPNFWHAFIGALSASLEQTKETANN